METGKATMTGPPSPAPLFAMIRCTEIDVTEVWRLGSKRDESKWQQW
jgi:hypothetical protein